MTRPPAVAWAALVAVAATLAAPGHGEAQPRATTAPALDDAAPPREPHPPAGLGASLALGWAGGGALARDGWVARLDYDVLPVLAPRGTVGPVFGFVAGLEYWRGRPDWGLGIPVALVVGVRAFPVRAQVGLGFEAIAVDRVAGDTGLGLWSPLATANVGLDVHGFRIGVDARIGRRWQLGAPDFTQRQLAVFVGGTLERVPPARAARVTPGRAARP